MSGNKDINRVGWTLYYVGRAFELFGLVLVTWAMVLFFGTEQMRPMIALTGAGSAFFVVGWLLSKNDPGREK